MTNYTNIIESLKHLDTTTNKVVDYYIDSIGYRHVIWWNQVSGITQHFYFDDNGLLYNISLSIKLKKGLTNFKPYAIIKTQKKRKELKK